MVTSVIKIASSQEFTTSALGVEVGNADIDVGEFVENEGMEEVSAGIKVAMGSIVCCVLNAF